MENKNDSRRDTLDIKAWPNLNDPPHETITYVLVVPGFVKVGRCRHLRRRVAELQCGNPERLLVLGYIAGDIETRLHHLLVRCGAKRASGEWFEDTERTREVLRSQGLLSGAGE